MSEKYTHWTTPSPLSADVFYGQPLSESSNLGPKFFSNFGLNPARKDLHCSDKHLFQFNSNPIQFNIHVQYVIAYFRLRNFSKITETRMCQRIRKANMNYRCTDGNRRDSVCRLYCEEGYSLRGIRRTKCRKSGFLCKFLVCLFFQARNEVGARGERLS